MAKDEHGFFWYVFYLFLILFFGSILLGKGINNTLGIITMVAGVLELING